MIVERNGNFVILTIQVGDYENGGKTKKFDENGGLRIIGGGGGMVQVGDLLCPEPIIMARPARNPEDDKATPPQPKSRRKPRAATPANKEEAANEVID